MILSTQAYLIKDGKWLMLLRNKKQNDVNEGKWIGVGGKFEPGETAEQCVKREIREETGYEAGRLEYAGMLDFIYEGVESERIWVYTCSDFSGSQTECTEGTLRWIEESKIMDLNLWEGDRIYLRQMLEHLEGQFHLRLTYNSEGQLTEALNI